MALQDKDRIFKNLYGFQDWRLAGARARGAWDNTKALIDKGHDWIINEVKASGPARPRRRRLPHGPQVVVHAQERSAAILPRHQCRRIASPAPARTARSCATTRTC